MALTIYCSWCNEHQFKLAQDTFSQTTAVKIQCPECSRFTKIAIGKNGELIVSQCSAD